MSNILTLIKDLFWTTPYQEEKYEYLDDKKDNHINYEAKPKMVSDIPLYIQCSGNYVSCSGVQVNIGDRV